MFKKVLVPLDGSRLAENTLPYAMELACKLGCEIQLLHVMTTHEAEQVHMHEAYLDSQVEAMTRTIAESLMGTKQPLPRDLDIHWATARGEAAEAILEFATENGVDLILIATHGLSGIKRWVIGSVAEKVLKASPVPVWLVREENETPEEVPLQISNMQNVIVPLDGSARAEAILPDSARLASMLQARLVLFQVVPDVYHIYTAGGRAAHVPYSPEHLARDKEMAIAYLKDAAARKGIAGPISFEARSGYAAEVILAIADETPDSLLVMSAHGKTGEQRWHHGSVTGKVMRGGGSPLLILGDGQSAD